MSKAFVIKNKEGKYLVFDPIEYSEDIRNAAIFKNTDLSSYCSEPSVILKDTKFVPITIYEGDPLELACDRISIWEMNMPIDKMQDYFIQQAKESEKDDNKNNNQ